MPAATSLTYDNLNGNVHTGSLFRKRGAWSSGTGVYTSGSATNTVPNIGFLTDKSIVIVEPTKNTAFTKLIEIRASRTYGNDGTITIGPLDGGTPNTPINFYWRILNP